MKDRVHGFVSRGSWHMVDVSEDTDGRSGPGIKFGFISQSFFALKIRAPLTFAGSKTAAYS